MGRDATSTGHRRTTSPDFLPAPPPCTACPLPHTAAAHGVFVQRAAERGLAGLTSHARGWLYEVAADRAGAAWDGMSVGRQAELAATAWIDVHRVRG